jgi:hypothetical protein
MGTLIGALTKNCGELVASELSEKNHAAEQAH